MLPRDRSALIVPLALVCGCGPPPSEPDAAPRAPEPAAPVGMREMLLRHAAEWKAAQAEGAE